MTVAHEENGLVVRTETSGELAPTASAAEKQFEIQSAIAIAKRFPRNEDTAFEKLMRAASRLSFAEDASYSFPRGGKTVEGPSVNLAREAARVWGNVRHGLDVIRDDDDSRQIRGWAWDVETNTKVSAEDEFRKLIYRKDKGWVKPDERDLRELTNRRGAILVRNCILQILPKDLIEDAAERAKSTIRNQAKDDPETHRKRIILAFSDIGITPEMLTSKLGHPLAQCDADELVNLRAIYKSISDGNSKWGDYLGDGTAAEPGTAPRFNEPREQTQPAAQEAAPEAQPAEPVTQTIEDTTVAPQKSCDRHGKFIGPGCPDCMAEPAPKKARR